MRTSEGECVQVKVSAYEYQCVSAILGYTLYHIWHIYKVLYMYASMKLIPRLFSACSKSTCPGANGSKFLFDMAVVSYKKEEFLVLDGGVATELTRAGFNLDVSQSHRTYTGL